MKLHHWFSSLIIFALLVIGIGVTVEKQPSMIIIPLVIFGVVFYLVKRPPSFNRNEKQANTYRSRSTTATKQNKQKKDRPRSKTVPFKVIEGGRDDNDTPRFH